MSNPLLIKETPPERLSATLSRAIYGSNSNPNSIYPLIYSNYHSNNVTNLIKILNRADSTDRSGVFKLANGSINQKAINLFKSLVNHENSELRLAARNFYFNYLKENELAGLNKKNLDSNSLNAVYDLMKQYFTASSEDERDNLCIKIAENSGIAYDKKGADLETAVDRSGAGSNAAGSQLNGFIALLRGSAVGGLLFEMIHHEREGFLVRNRDIVPTAVLSGRATSPALAHHCAQKYVKVNRITEHISRAYRGVFYAVKPGESLAPQLVSAPGFNQQNEIDEEIKFLREAGQLTESEAKGFNFNFKSLAEDLFCANKDDDRQQAIKKFALAYALLNFRIQKIEASTVSNKSKFSPLGYSLISSDKETALKYAKRQLDLMKQVLNERFLDNEQMEVTFREVLKDNYETYLQTIALSQLCAETSQFDARVRALSDRFSDHNMGLGAPRMTPIPIETFVDQSHLNKTYNKANKDKLALEIQNKIKERYGDPLVELKDIKKIFKYDLSKKSYSIKPKASIDLGRGPQSYAEWISYNQDLTSNASSVLDSFMVKVSSSIKSAKFINETQLSSELDQLQKELEAFIKDPEKSLNNGSAGAQKAYDVHGSPLSYNLASKVRDFVSKSSYLGSAWSEIFGIDVNDITFIINNPNAKAKDVAKACIEQIKEKRLKKGERGNKFQQSLETGVRENPFEKLLSADAGSLNSDERIIQELILGNIDREVGVTGGSPLERLLLGSGQADDPRASEKMLLGLMQLVALGDKDPKTKKPVRDYVGGLLGTNITNLNVSKILGNNAGDDFKTAVKTITNDGITSRDIGYFHRFAYYDSLSTIVSEDLSTFRVDIENKRKDSLSTLLGPLLKTLGKEGEHMQVLEALEKSMFDISTESLAASQVGDDERPSLMSDIKNKLGRVLRPTLIRSSETQSQWLKDLSADHGRIDILALILQVCKELFNLAPPPQKENNSPFSLN